MRSLCRGARALAAARRADRRRAIRRRHRRLVLLARHAPVRVHPQALDGRRGAAARRTGGRRGRRRRAAVPSLGSMHTPPCSVPSPPSTSKGRALDLKADNFRVAQPIPPPPQATPPPPALSAAAAASFAARHRRLRCRHDRARGRRRRRTHAARPRHGVHQKPGDDPHCRGARTAAWRARVSPSPRRQRQRMRRRRRHRRQIAPGWRALPAAGPPRAHATSGRSAASSLRLSPANTSLVARIGAPSTCALPAPRCRSSLKQRPPSCRRSTCSR